VLRSEGEFCGRWINGCLAERVREGGKQRVSRSEYAEDVMVENTLTAARKYGRVQVKRGPSKGYKPGTYGARY